MPIGTLTSKGQITIPKAIRDSLGLEPGDKVDFVLEADGRVILRPATTSVFTLAGILERSGRRAITVEEMKDTVRKRGGKS